MSQRYGRIHINYWTSPDIIGLSPETKLIGAYILTCPHGNMIGCFRLPIAYVVDDLAMGYEAVSEGFRNLCDKGFVTHDSAVSWLLISKFLKWNPIDNPNQGKAAAKQVDAVPRNSSVYAPLMQILAANPGNFPEGFLNRLETVGEPYRTLQPQLQPHPHPEQKDLALISEKPELPAAGVFDLPLNDGSEYAVPKKLFEEYVEAYRGVDVAEQLRGMRVWILSNEKNAKTRGGIKRFMNGWLQKAQDRDGSHKRAPRAENFKDIDYAKGYELPDGECVGRIPS
jgi:hypothetical protein